MGGIFERTICCMKQCLRKLLRQARLNYQELLTLLKEIGNDSNIRPLTVVYYHELIQLSTPIKLLHGRNINSSIR